MPMSYNYNMEKLSNAVRSLATGKGSIQDRLINAYIYHLIHVNPDFLSEDNKVLYLSLQDKVTRKEAKGNEGSVKATVELMSDDEAQEIASQILDLTASHRFEGE